MHRKAGRSRHAVKRIQSAVVRMNPAKQSLIHKSQRLALERRLEKSEKKADRESSAAQEAASPVKWRKSLVKSGQRRTTDVAKKKGSVARKSETSRKGKTVIRAAASTKDSVSLAGAQRSTKAAMRQYRTPTKRRPDTASIKAELTESAKEAYNV